MLLLKSLYAKIRIHFIAAVSVILAIIGLINFYFIFNVTAQSNDECVWRRTVVGVNKTVVNPDGTKDSTALIFGNVKVDGVAWNAGIRNGDELVSIDGIKAKNALIMTHVLDRVNSGDYATYVVKRGNNTFETKVLVKKLINFFGLALSLLSFIWLVVGYIILMAKPDGKTQNAFYRIGVVAILYSTISLLFRGQGVASNPIIGNRTLFYTVASVLTFGNTFFPFVYIHFFLQFPSRYKILTKKHFNTVWYLAAFLLFALSLAVIVSGINGLNPGAILRGIVNAIQGYSIFAAIFLGTILLFISYSKLKSREERNSIFVILVSCLIGFTVLIYTLTLQNALADSIYNTPQYFMPIILIAVIPIGFGYSLFKYSLMDMSDVLKNSILYLVATMSLAGVYFLLIYVIGQGISNVIGTDYQGIIAGVVFVVFAVIFQSTKDRFQSLITRKFYPEQFAFQKVVLKFSTEVASTVGLDNILDSTLRTFVEHLRLQYFGIVLYNEENKLFELKRCEGFFSGNLSMSINRKKIKKYFDDKALYKRPAAIERGEFETVFSADVVEKLVDEHIYTVIPLMTKSKIIGFTFFGLKYSGSQFSGKDIELLSAAANQTALSIENARLYEMEAQRLTIARDLENARVIQESLLPNIIPQFKNVDIAGRMIPAMQVGGDYYDIIKVNEDKFFIVIGDVSGKGLSASFYMSKLQTIIKLYCEENRSPKEILIDINNRITESIEKGWFITVSLALFNLKESKIQFCRAGHTPLLHVKNDQIYSLQPNGIGIGLERGEVFDANLQELEIPITGDEKFFFYSDGVNEAENDMQEFFGLDMLQKVLLSNGDKPAKGILDEILTEIRKFRGKALQNDDITMTMVKINK